MKKLDAATRHALILQHLPRTCEMARRFAQRRIRDEDLEQDALLALVQSAASFDARRPLESFWPYARRYVVGRLMRSVERRIRQQLREKALDIALEAPAPKDPHAADEASDAVRFALRLLPVRERRLVLDFFGLGGKPPKSMEEIAAEAGVTKGRIAQRLQRSRELIADTIRAQGWENLFDPTREPVPASGRAPRARVI